MQAVVRLEPELHGKPVAILAGAPPLTKVFAVNHKARNLGIETGMTKVQAEAFQGIAWRWRSPSQEATARHRRRAASSSDFRGCKSDGDASVALQDAAKEI